MLQQFRFRSVLFYVSVLLCNSSLLSVKRHPLQRNILSARRREDTSAGSLFFLFLTSAGIQRQDIWASFFEDATLQTPYRTFVHCTDWKTCDAEIQVDNPLNATLVGTVPTFYCKDLVTAMTQLLKAATLESTSPHDKFVFLSDSTLPVKPFELVYSALTARTPPTFVSKAQLIGRRWCSQTWSLRTS